MIPTIGRIVHFVLTDGPNAGQHRPAIIVRVWDSPEAPATESTAVQLQVFTDGDGNGRNDCMPNIVWKTSVKQDATRITPGTWHEPERTAESKRKAS